MGCSQLRQRIKIPDEHKQFIREHYKGKTTKELTNLVNNEFKTNYQTKNIYYFKRNNKLVSGITGYFEKGQIPKNKGKKQTDYMTAEAIAKTKATRFKKGNKPINFKPVGSERIDAKDGYIYIKTKNPSTWRLKHHVVWEENHGEIPKGHMIVFLNQDKKDCSIDNLTIAKKSIAPIASRYSLYTTDKELTKTGLLIGELMQQTKIKGENK